MKNLILILTLLSVINLGAQNKIATGVILDSKTHEALPFTNIGVYGTSRGTVSNMEGAVK